MVSAYPASLICPISPNLSDWEIPAEIGSRVIRRRDTVAIPLRVVGESRHDTTDNDDMSCYGSQPWLRNNDGYGGEKFFDQSIDLPFSICLFSIPISYFLTN